MGGRYAFGRNYDCGPGGHGAMFCLSPFVRRRSLLEEELVDVALAAYGLDGAEKSIQEVFWRGYFKGIFTLFALVQTGIRVCSEIRLPDQIAR